RVCNGRRRRRRTAARPDPLRLRTRGGVRPGRIARLRIGLPWRSDSIDLVALQLLVESTDADPEPFGGEASVPTDVGQCPHDGIVLDIGHGPALIIGMWGVRGRQENVGTVNQVAFSEDGRALE